MWFRKRKAPAPAPTAPVTRERQAFQRAGRRFLDSTYLLPKDGQEVNRLDFQHYLLRYALRGNYVAPIRHPQYILDVGELPHPLSLFLFLRAEMTTCCE